MSQEYDQLISSIQNSKKYRMLQIPKETILDILKLEEKKYPNKTSLEASVRRKLHNIVAPYLDRVDYAHELNAMELLWGSDNEYEIKNYCKKILSGHASTRERLSRLEEFYQFIFDNTGVPSAILDLACGLNPFAIPFMHLPKSTMYYAYDIHKPRIDLINKFFMLYGMQPLALQQDILVNPPSQQAEITFFFKEAHRLEKRQSGANRTLWQTINTRYLVITLPAVDLKHHHDLTVKHREILLDATQGLPWRWIEKTIQDEIVFIIEKV